MPEKVVGIKDIDRSTADRMIAAHTDASPELVFNLIDRLTNLALPEVRKIFLPNSTAENFRQNFIDDLTNKLVDVKKGPVYNRTFPTISAADPDSMGNTLDITVARQEEKPNEYLLSITTHGISSPVAVSAIKNLREALLSELSGDNTSL